MPLHKLVAGNWKMHGLSADLAQIKAIADASDAYPSVDVALCVPAILIERAARAVPGFAIGGQDVHQAEKGAHTGCVSADMLLDAGATLTIVGHSERRDAQRESDADVRAKAEAALARGLDVILCVGESLEVRESGGAVEVVVKQLSGSLPNRAGPARLSIAYEPIWAIGTGKVPTTGEIGEMHSAVRAALLDERLELVGRVADRHRRIGIAAQSFGRHLDALAGIERDRRLAIFDRFDLADRGTSRSVHCRTGDDRRLRGRGARLNLGVELRLGEREHEFRTVDPEARLWQQGLMLVGLDLQIVALDRGDGADRRAGRVNDRHPDRLGRGGRGNGKSKSGKSPKNQSHVSLPIHHVELTKSIVSQN
jgi:triosephosphate isomerase